MAKYDNFRISRFSKNDFTYNLSDSKIFTWCVIHNVKIANQSAQVCTVFSQNVQYFKMLLNLIKTFSKLVNRNMPKFALPTYFDNFSVKSLQNVAN